MQVLAVVGGDPPLDASAGRLDGRVALVRHADRLDQSTVDESRSNVDADPSEAGQPRGNASHGDDARHPAGDPTLGDDTGRFVLDDDGRWHGTTTGTGLATLLDRLTPAYDYALLAGATRLRVPTIVVGDREVAGTVVDRVEETPDAATIATTVREVEPHVTLETLVAASKRAAGEEFAGAIATFTGRVRARDGPDDPETTHLSFEKYEGVASERLAQIERELKARDGVYDVRTHHRTGPIEAGEDIVFVVVLAGHREEAFRTVSDGIDRLKDEVPIFKKEITTQETFWRHERDA